MRLASIPLRAGLSVLVAVAASSATSQARAADDVVLDLGGTRLETRRVARGSFTQGSPPTEVGHAKDEEPPHEVTITRDFWMGKYPVTRAQFARFVNDTRYLTDAEKGQSGGSGWDGKALVPKKEFNWRNPGFAQTDDHPAVLVTYGDATAFVAWASRKTGKRVRLPTEAEREYAARGGTSTPWYGADADVAALGWFKGNAGNGTRPVGQKKANPLGLFDMAGNVFEWTRDVYAPYGEGAATDPEIASGNGTEPERRVLRGGSWLHSSKRARSASRHRMPAGARNADHGFRIVVASEETISPAVTGSTSDFAPASPLGMAGAGGGAGGGASRPPGAPELGGASGLPAEGHLAPVTHGAAGADPFSWGMLLAWPLAAASAAVAWMLLRNKRSRSAVTTHPPGVSTRGAADGFVVRVPDARPGTRVRYECMVNGAAVTDVVPLAGEETFVYTGSLPTAIRIVDIMAASSRPSVVVASVAPPLPSSRPSVGVASVAPPLPSSRPSVGGASVAPPVPSSRPIGVLLEATEPMSMPAPLHESSRAEVAPSSTPPPMLASDVAPTLLSLPEDGEPSSRDVAASSDREVSSRSEAPPSDDGPASSSEVPSASDVFLGHPRAY